METSWTKWPERRGTKYCCDLKSFSHMLSTALCSSKLPAWFLLAKGLRSGLFICCLPDRGCLLFGLCVCVVEETRTKRNQRNLVKTPDISRGIPGPAHMIFSPISWVFWQAFTPIGQEWWLNGLHMQWGVQPLFMFSKQWHKWWQNAWKI